jgi:hypothetical protein
VISCAMQYSGALLLEPAGLKGVSFGLPRMASMPLIEACNMLPSLPSRFPSPAVSPPFSPDAEIHRLIPLQNATSHAFNKLSELYWNIWTPGSQTNTADRPSRQPKGSYLDSLRHPLAVHRYKFRKNEKTPPGDQGSTLPGRSLANRSAVTETLWRDSGIRETDFWVYCMQWMRISRASIADPIRDEAFKPILTGLSCL